MSRALAIVRQWDDDLELAGEIALKPHQWPAQRHALLSEISAAGKLAAALRRAESVLAHYTYSAENRAALADIRAALAEYGGDSTESGGNDRG